MKQNYIKHFFKILNARLLFLALSSALTTHSFAQQTWTFTPCGATGAAGPTQTQANSTYSTGNNLNGSVTISGQGIQQFTVPSTGVYIIETQGARGYNPSGFGGRGAIIKGDFTLTAGTVLKIAVGQEGQINPAAGTLQFGGGGGSFVSLLNNTPLIIAGGGGGSHATSYAASSADGTVSTTGNNGVGTTGGAGGTAGSGGAASNSANGGAGFFGDGGGTTGPALSFTNGALGGNLLATPYANGGIGGFGGGGGTQSWNNNRGGGGGGYSGGGGGQLGQPSCWGGGGGSFNSGTNQLNLSGANTFSDGVVLITEACNISLYAANNTNSLNPMICTGQSVTLVTNAISNYSWSTGATSSSLVVSPTSNTVYALTATSPSNCSASKSISITVSSGLPVLSIANPSTNICLGRTVSLTATGANSYTWANAGVVNGQTFTPVSTAAYTVSGQNGCGTTVATTTINVAPLAVSVLANPTLVCQGYTSTLTAVAGVSGFTWTPNNASGSTAVVSPVANTIYTVTASDGTCSGTATLAVNTQPTPTISASATFTNICEGDQVTLTASGASTYTWNPGNLNGASVAVSPATSTLYAVSGTNSFGCISSANQIVLVKPAPSVSITASKLVACLSESVILNASGAAAYAWTSGPQVATYTVFPNGPTAYSVTGVGSNGCIKMISISVSVLIPNVVVPSSLSVCAGNSTTITATGATTYSWNGVNFQSNNYIIIPSSNTLVTLTANTSSMTLNCITNHSININVNANPTVNVVATKTTVCRNQPTTLTASGALSYSWGTLGTTASVVVSPSIQTSYQVKGTDVNGCETFTNFVVKVSTCAGINEQANESAISVFPNPNNGAFTVSSKSDIQLQLVSSLGQVVQLLELNQQNDFKVSVDGIANGVYFLIGQNANEKINEKIVITN